MRTGTRSSAGAADGDRTAAVTGLSPRLRSTTAATAAASATAAAAAGRQPAGASAPQLGGGLGDRRGLFVADQGEQDALRGRPPGRVLGQARRDDRRAAAGAAPRGRLGRAGCGASPRGCVSLPNAGRPVAANTIVDRPREDVGRRAELADPASCSGAMYAGVPTALVVVVVAEASRARAMPKSITRGPVGADQDVVRLEVAVDDARLVDAGERGRGADRQAFERGAVRGPSVATRRSQRRARRRTR